ncbi:MAG: hypothetical protein K2W88_16970, partial [Pararheinheimera sp.]|nr:hypothetical protein [Rheinheimera sp.]
MVRQVNLNSYKKSLIHSCIALAVCQYPAAVFAEDATTQQQEKIFSIIKKIKQRYDQQEQAEKTYASAGKNSTPETPQSSSTSTVAAETFTTEDVTAEA